ncbi:MAG: dihydrofolate reductase family protein [Vitreoscilla sp.]
MVKIVAINHFTLDGVIQGPGSPDEDPRDGFEYGGWAGTQYDPVLQQTVGARMGSSWSQLAGRRTYEHFSKVWPKMPKPNPFTDILNTVDKFVVSNSLREPLSWENSHLLQGDAADAVGRLKAEHDKRLVIFGSGVLVRSLMSKRLVDEFVLQIHPVVLGKGRRLFEPGVRKTDFTLVESTVTKAGIMVCAYQLRQ